MRKLLLTLILGLFVFTLAACGTNNSTQGEQRTTLVVGMECAYAPYNWTTSTPTETSHPIYGTNLYCDGYDVKIAKMIADELNLELVIKALDWNGLITALKANQIDAVIAGMSPTANRKTSISFTDAYYRSGEDSTQVVVVLKDGPFSGATTLNDFSGAKIGAQLGTLQDEEGLIEQMTGAIHATPLSDYATLVTALKSGTINGFIAELPVATQIVNNNETLAMINFAANEGFILSEAFTTTAIGLRKADTQLRDQINAVLATISEEQRTTWMNEFIELSSAE